MKREDGKKPGNRLATEKSPYLLQHAKNPVDWHPWGEEAFRHAHAEDKPVFLSVGYSTCHWCHVMERESFEDPEVAKSLNEAFVCVKVDREERPDIDGVFMTVCQMLTGSGGWPLTILMTPDRQPFFAGTYFPKTSRFGRPGLLEVTAKISELWRGRRDKVLEAANAVVGALQKTADSASGQEAPDAALIDAAFQGLSGMYDQERGGFGNAPKFPTPHNLLFLLRYWKRTGTDEALAMVEKTLNSMRRGGIFDQVGYGLHRYSTDKDWLLPHFEKMLHDQALFALAATEAFQASGKTAYREMAVDIFTYVLRDLRSPEGAFYSAEDADSEGEEGRFYVWTREELAGLLSTEELGILERYWGVQREGNFHDEATGRPTGANILHVADKTAPASQSLGMPEGIREKLLAARSKRVRPHLDDKVLTDWNGLMIAALAKAGALFHEMELVDAARKAADFLLSRMWDGNRLLHRYRDGEAAIPGFLEDYAFLSWGLLELHQASFDSGYLKTAWELTHAMASLFQDTAEGGFYHTAHDAETLLVRRKEVYDGAVPSGNSVAMANLLRLGKLLGNSDYEHAAWLAAKALAADARHAPHGHAMFLSSLDLALSPTTEVLIAGDLAGEDTKRLVAETRKRFLPGLSVLVVQPGEEGEEVRRLVPHAADCTPRDGRAAAYVCKDGACREPVTDVAELAGIMKTLVPLRS